jgi:hypothetical protein
MRLRTVPKIRDALVEAKSAAARANAGALEVSLHADEQRRELVVEADLAAAHDAGGVRAVPDETVVIAIVAPAAADIEAGVETSPREHRRRDIDRCLIAGWQVRGIGRSGGERSGYDQSRNRVFHVVVPWDF